MSQKPVLASASEIAVAEFLKKQDDSVMYSVLCNAMKCQDMEVLRVLDSIGMFDLPGQPAYKNPFGSVVHIAHGVKHERDPEGFIAALAGERFYGPAQLARDDPQFTAFVNALFDRYVAFGQPDENVVSSFIVAASVLRHPSLFRAASAHLGEGLARFNRGRNQWVPMFGEVHNGSSLCHPVTYALLYGQNEMLDQYLDAGWRPHMKTVDVNGGDNGYFVISCGQVDRDTIIKLVDLEISERTDAGVLALRQWAGAHLNWWSIDSDSRPLGYQIEALKETGLYESDPEHFFTSAAVDGGWRVCEHLAPFIEWSTVANTIVQALSVDDHWRESAASCWGNPRPGMTHHTIALIALCVAHGRLDFLPEAIPLAKQRKAHEVVAQLEAHCVSSEQ